TAFKQQVQVLGQNTTLLVDTYNIEKGINNAIQAGGKNLGGIRIDSGDLYEETLKARQQLDNHGNVNTKIILSSDIDEYVIQELIDRKTPVDGIGVGTQLVTGSSHPTAGMVYKLVAIQHTDNTSTVPVAKASKDKQSLGGEKFISRDYKQS